MVDKKFRKFLFLYRHTFYNKEGQELLGVIIRKVGSLVEK